MKALSPAADRAYRLWNQAKQKNPEETTESIVKRLKLTSSTLHRGRVYYEKNNKNKSTKLKPKVIAVPPNLGLQSSINVVAGPNDQSMLIVGNTQSVAEIASTILKSWIP